MTARHFAYVALSALAFLSAPRPAHAGKPQTSDNFAQVRGFKVEITGKSGKPVETAWETLSPGELVSEIPGPGDAKVISGIRGHRDVGGYRLAYGDSEGLAAMTAWLAACSNGGDCLREVRIIPAIEVAPGKPYVAGDAVTFGACLPVAVDVRAIETHGGVDLRCYMAGGAQSAEVKAFQTISNVLKTKHDTVKNSINNVR